MKGASILFLNYSLDGIQGSRSLGVRLRPFVGLNISCPALPPWPSIPSKDIRPASVDTSVYWLASYCPLLPSPIVQVNLIRLEMTQLCHSQHIFGPGSTCMEHSTWVGKSKSKHPGGICPLPSRIMGDTQVRKNLWRPRVKLLTEEEYREQSNVETRKALEELRRCTSALQ